MPVVFSNGLDLFYESIGEGEPLLLVMGLGAQLVAWDDDFCAQLAGQGFRVIRFDNRDVGLSTKLDHVPKFSVRRMFVRSLVGLPISAPYTLRDMADDTVGLLDALGIDRAHIVGASMGGMIAQIVAIEYPQRVRSLTSIMSHPGDRLSRVPKPRAARALMRPAPRSREEAIERHLATFRVIGSPGFQFDEARRRSYAGRAYDRSFYPRGFVRQIAAIAASPSRVGALRRVLAPTLVIHGAQDPLVPPRGGRLTARSVPGARLHIIPGMGHDLPQQAWPEITGAIADIAGV